jgi:hypothetical protein
MNPPATMQTKRSAPMSNAERQQNWRDRHRGKKPSVQFGPPNAGNIPAQQFGSPSPATVENPPRAENPMGA